MIDTHCHCLFGVDDGAGSLSISLDMLEEAAADGISKVICTSHSLPGSYFANDIQTLKPPFEEIKAALSSRNIDIEIFLGAEIYLLEDTLCWAKEKRLVTLNNTGRILLEFPWHEEDINFDPLPGVKGLLALGYQIIVAHPERYPFIHKDYSYLDKLRQLGCDFQINRTSLAFSDDRNYKLAWKLLEDGYADVVASDAHRPYSRRSMILSDSYQLVAEAYGDDEAQRMFIKNPQALISGDKLLLR